MNGAVGQGFPRYLHRPYRLLWFERDELGLMAGLYVISVFTTFKLLLLIPPAVIFFRKEKRKRPRGFVVHIFYRLGLTSFRGYPGSFVKKLRG